VVTGTFAEHPGTAATTAPVVRLEAVHKSFGDNEVLKGIDLEVATAEVLTIVGPSGSGKSTLLRCVNLLEPLNAGRIFFEGEEITRKGTTSRPCASGSEWCSSSSTSFRTRP
jgi:polar amino acid transport system ATP-binding protein